MVKKAAALSHDQWRKYQAPEIVAKWPLPEYMQGEKGSMQFRDETFAIVTRWTADTKIAYRPHAKAPGSKSHLRYERYSKARTVGEALRLSSYPTDWCWDYERGFIKVLGGMVRDEPLDITKVEEAARAAALARASIATPVDKHLHTWMKKELAKKIGVKVSELAVDNPHGESLMMRGQRLLAQKFAREALEAADSEGRRISDEEVLKTLKLWAFFKNPWRQNVMKEGQEWVYSDTMGMLRDRQGDIHLTAITRRYPQVAEVYARWLTDRLPKDMKSFKFTSMNVNSDYAAQIHRDAGNFGPSFIKAFGEFKGGELNYWPEDAGGSLESIPKNQKVTLNLQDGLALFNGNCAHSVNAFEGKRFSIVYFTLGCHAEISTEDRGKLQRLGISCPAKTEDPYALLRAPRGHGKAKATTVQAGVQPSYCFWRAADLCAKPRPRTAGDAKKRRLEPEDAKSFYNTEARRQKPRAK